MDGYTCQLLAPDLFIVGVIAPPPNTSCIGGWVSPTGNPDIDMEVISIQELNLIRSVRNMPTILTDLFRVFSKP
jgi:hypothetical protein